MPFVGFVHSEKPERPGEPEELGRWRWEPNWRVWRWLLAAVVAASLATLTDGYAELVLVFFAVAAVCRAVVVAVPEWDGMRDHRQ
jgi:hypothetical protein